MIIYAMLLTGINCLFLGEEDWNVASPSLSILFNDWEANEEEGFVDGTSNKCQGNPKKETTFY